MVIWNTIIQWFSSVIEFMYQLTVLVGVPSYGLAIIMLTIIIKIVLFPLNIKQMKSMRGMQELQPRLKTIQARYKDEPQVMQAKVMELYKQHGVSPFGGCLPLLIQMPILIAFYRSLYNFQFTVTAHAQFLWIPNISSPDPFYVLPVLAGITTYVQQRISMVDTSDPTQKSMLYITPIMMAWIAWKVPAGLPIYWVVFNLLGILQQLYVNRSHSLAKKSPETSAGDTVQEIEKQESKEETPIKASTMEKPAVSDKGGKNGDRSQSSRKRRKKR